MKTKEQRKLYQRIMINIACLQAAIISGYAIPNTPFGLGTTILQYGSFTPWELRIMTAIVIMPIVLMLVYMAFVGPVMYAYDVKYMDREKTRTTFVFNIFYWNYNHDAPDEFFDATLLGIVISTIVHIIISVALSVILYAILITVLSIGKPMMGAVVGSLALIGILTITKLIIDLSDPKK